MTYEQIKHIIPAPKWRHEIVSKDGIDVVAATTDDGRHAVTIVDNDQDPHGWMAMTNHLPYVEEITTRASVAGETWQSCRFAGSTYICTGDVMDKVFDVLKLAGNLKADRYAR